METDENVFHDEQDFQNVVDENMDLDNFVENGVADTKIEITKF